MSSSLKKKLGVCALWILGVSAFESARAQVGDSVENWTAPALSSKAADVTFPLTFVGMQPCRIVDTRGAAGPHGGPILPPNMPRDFDLRSGPCTGIPSGAAAYSLNFTVTQTQGSGDLRVWPAGFPPPLVSTLNYIPNQTVANAAIVPALSSAVISLVAAVSGTHLIIDINGYFTAFSNPDRNLSFTVQKQGAPGLAVTNTEGGASGSGGIAGLANSSGFGSFGVVGTNASFANTDIGGVAGTHGPGFIRPFYGPAGVFGISRDSFGVVGVSQNNFAVAGSNVTDGTERTYGALACSDTTAVCGSGNLSISGSKSFVEPHPTEASKVIKFVSLEGNEAGTYFRGRAKFERGLARIRVPGEFRMVTHAEGLSIQVTPIGEMASVAVVAISLEEIAVKASRNVEFFYLVQGMRKGYEDFTPIAEEAFFVPRSAEYRMPSSLSPEAKRKLIANGTYNADGTVNLETAKRLGWTEKWKGGTTAPKKD